MVRGVPWYNVDEKVMNMNLRVTVAELLFVCKWVILGCGVFGDVLIYIRMYGDEIMEIGCGMAQVGTSVYCLD